ncbi:MAG: DUF4287 domain-containing protein [Proteobacteria bacterium]|nr:DUF4287 domain-containing protein [Pseudomonadota bacterium]
MGTGDAGAKAAGFEEGLTERQKKWFASVKANFETKTGKTLAEWVSIAKTCPHDKPKARADWLREHHGLGVNHAAFVLSEAFPSADPSWDDPVALRGLLWKDAASLAILEAVEKAVAKLPEHVSGQRKAFTGFSRNFQFAAMRPVKGGGAMLGLAVAPEANARLAPPKREGWSERLKAVVQLASPADVDAEIEALLKQAWEKS